VRGEQQELEGAWCVTGLFEAQRERTSACEQAGKATVTLQWHFWHFGDTNQHRNARQNENQREGRIRTGMACSHHQSSSSGLRAGLSAWPGLRRGPALSQSPECMSLRSIHHRVLTAISSAKSSSVTCPSVLHQISLFNITKKNKPIKRW
jgi:hypothetical protein